MLLILLHEGNPSSTRLRICLEAGTEHSFLVNTEFVLDDANWQGFTFLAGFLGEALARQAQGCATEPRGSIPHPRACTQAGHRDVHTRTPELVLALRVQLPGTVRFS